MPRNWGVQNEGSNISPQLRRGVSNQAQVMSRCATCPRGRQSLHVKTILCMMKGRQADECPCNAQSMNLCETSTSGQSGIPKLDQLTNLTALNLSENSLTKVPACLGKLGSLRFLDVSMNPMLWVCCCPARAQILPSYCLFRKGHGVPPEGSLDRGHPSV